MDQTCESMDKSLGYTRRQQPDEQDKSDREVHIHQRMRSLDSAPVHGRRLI